MSDVALSTLELRAPLPLPARLRDRIAAHAESAWPHEACGFLLGRSGHSRSPSVTRVARACNSALRPADGYRIGPDALRTLVEETDPAGGDALIGFYHSHPDRAARPSERDLRLSVPGFWYVAVSVRAGRAGARCSWYVPLVPVAGGRGPEGRAQCPS